MTDLLKKAFREASKLTPEQQDEVASLVLAELESEQLWDQKFSGSSAQLSKLAQSARDEVRQRKTEALDPDDL